MPARIVEKVDWKKSTIYNWCKKLKEDIEEKERKEKLGEKVDNKPVLFYRKKGQGRPAKISDKAKDTS